MSDADDLGVIDGDQAVVTIKGQAYSFGPLTVGQLPAFARAVKPMADDLGPVLAGDFSLDKLIGLMADHGDGAIDAISVATRIPREVVEGAAPDDLVKILALALSLNRDFFVRRLSPTVQAVVKRASSLGAGPTQSKP